MEEIQQMLNEALDKILQYLLEKRLAEKFKAAGIKATDSEIEAAAVHVLNGESTTVGDAGDGMTIEITADDIKYIESEIERLDDEHVGAILNNLADRVSATYYEALSERWSEEFQAQQAESEGFKQRLEVRWGKALGKLRMLLTLIREWAQEAADRQHKTKDTNNKRLKDVMLRLHVRACQVTNEIIVLLENGFADGALARWRTLHEITIVAAVIAKFGEEIAERYVHYQIVESFAALKAYERAYKGLGYKAPSKRTSEKVRKDYDKVVKRFGKEFGEQYGWAAHHLEKVRPTFADLEKEAGEEVMRSPYKMASYNVHASPKGIYFKIGGIGESEVYLAGASNAGLTDPAQHAAMSLVEITSLTIGDSLVFDDLVIAGVIARLRDEIPKEFWRAERQLRKEHSRRVGRKAR
ncbi:MAG TPA: DUF5677 domain-containing protein [Magnetospirillaceae bacterium]|jgi:hypothetical protein